MKIACLSFTDKGKSVGDKLQSISTPKYTIHHYKNNQIEGGIKNLLNYAWQEYDGFVFISSTGIAIRMINPYIEHKTIDPAVVVVDDSGKFSISLLSGHLGGANELAQWIGERINAMPIITTASDNRNIEAIDLFAKRNNYYIEDMEAIKSITAMMVNGKVIGFYSEDDKTIDYPNLVDLSLNGVILSERNNLRDLIQLRSFTDVQDDKARYERIEGLIIISSRNYDLGNIDIPIAYLRPKNINIGIGCRKGVKAERIIEAIEDSLKKINLSINSIKTIGTVEVKKDEQGIIQAVNHFKCPMKIFSIEEIKEVEDKFEKSQFVKDTIGVYSVSEPSAYLLGGELILMKSKHNGITISIAKEIENG